MYVDLDADYELHIYVIQFLFSENTRTNKIENITIWLLYLTLKYLGQSLVF